MALSVNEHEELIARVPYAFNQEKLNLFIKEKTPWIIKQINQAKQNNLKYKPFELFEGALISLIENQYTIRLKPVKKAKIEANNIILPMVDSKNKLIEVIKKLAKQYLSERCEFLAKNFNFKYTTIKITTAKTVWGSCNCKNGINLTYKLILTPKDVIDYIIIHELSHTLVKNHSKKFYQVVASCLPNYKQAEVWLKRNRGVMNYI